MVFYTDLLLSRFRLFLEEFLSNVGFLSSLSSSCTVCGDFNIHVDSISPLILEFKSVVNSCCLAQHIAFPTHLHVYTLHLLLAPAESSAISYP